MPYNNSLNRSRGMLQSRHSPHTQTVTCSSGGTLNPTADNFNPQRSTEATFLSQAQSHNATEATVSALVPHEHQCQDEQVTVSKSGLRKLTDFFNEEIPSLRRDIEMLKQGGWTVTVGAFQAPKQVDLSEVEATRQRLQNSSGLLGALTARSQFLSPATAQRQIEGPASPPLTPTRASTTTAAPAVQSSSKPHISIEGRDSTTGELQSSKCTLTGSANGSVAFSDPAEPPESSSVESVTSPHIHMNTAIPSREDPSFAHMSSAGNWQPLAIRNLRPLSGDVTHPIPKPSSMQTFSWEFLRKFLLGRWWSPGFYYHPVSEGTSILPSRTYYLLDNANDPYVPCEPGAHGAKLTAFFNPENPEDVDGDIAANAFTDVPVFVSASNYARRNKLGLDGVDADKCYIYMGMYSQLRFSDKIDYDRLIEQVPDAIKMYWAEQLADPARPAWVTEALMKAFVPKPEYEGPLPGAGEDEVIRKEVGRHIRGLKEWEAEARKKVVKLTREDVLKAFDAEDAADPPGLRLWWEYLECVGWNRGFYDVLVREQEKWMAKEKQVMAEREGW